MIVIKKFNVSLLGVYMDNISSNRMYTTINSTIMKNCDIIAVISLSVASVLLTIFPVHPLFQVPIGLIITLFIPGYLLMYILYPKKNDLIFLERIAFSIGINFLIIPVIIKFSQTTSRALNIAQICLIFIKKGKYEDTLTIASLNTALLLFIYIIICSFYIRKKRICIGFGLIDFLKHLPKFLKLYWRDKHKAFHRKQYWFSAVISAIIILMFITNLHFMFTSYNVENLDFYILRGDNGIVIPSSIKINETFSLTLGLTNHKNYYRNCSIEIFITNESRKISDLREFTNSLTYISWNQPINSSTFTNTTVGVGANEEIEKSYNLIFNELGNFRIYFCLMEDSFVIRMLAIWMVVYSAS